MFVFDAKLTFCDNISPTKNHYLCIFCTNTAMHSSFSCKSVNTYRFVGILFFVLLADAVSVKGQEGFCLMELNTENFFDPVDNPYTNDNDFLPEAVRRWTWAKFTRKANNIGKTIAAVGGNRLPDVVALCEVENDTVLNRLTNTGVLRRSGYKYFITHSLDDRGINVALLYDSSTFFPILCRTIRPDFRGLPEKRTRDILYVSGETVTGDTIDIFVCHYPSKLDKHKQGTPYRERISAQIRAESDSLCKARKNPYIIITGDFNDTPRSPSLQILLKPKDIKGQSLYREDGLYRLIDEYSGTKDIRGTYCFRGRWETIDNIIVSGSFLNPSKRIYLKPRDCGIFCAPFLLTTKNGEPIPYRTYNGMRYQPGFSDHLPTYARFSFNP